MHVFDFQHSACRIMESLSSSYKASTWNKTRMINNCNNWTIFGEFCYIITVIMSTTESDYLTVAIWRGSLFHCVIKYYMRVWCPILMHKREMPNESGWYCYQHPIPFSNWLFSVYISWEYCMYVLCILRILASVLKYFFSPAASLEFKHISPTNKKNSVVYVNVNLEISLYKTPFWL